MGYDPPDWSIVTQPEYTPGWNHDVNGWWYADSKTTYHKSCWQNINDHKYYFNPDGYAVTGWHEIDRKWYCITLSPEPGMIWSARYTYPTRMGRSVLVSFEISEIVLYLFGKVTNCPC